MNKEETQFIIDGMIWSFSRLRSYEQCPRQFKMQYVDAKVPTDSNAFSEFGSFTHGLIERYYKGKADIYELLPMFTNEYESHVTSEFPFQKIEHSYYNSAYNFFKTFDGSIYKDCDLIGSELKCKSQVAGLNFVGYIDLLMRNKNGRLKIVDFKSKSKFKNEKERTEYARQLYLYAIFVHDLYGEWPEEMEFYLYRSQKSEKELFQMSGVDDCINWIKHTYNEIKNEEHFDCKTDDYYCKYLCDFRSCCKNADLQNKNMHKDKNKTPTGKYGLHKHVFKAQ